MARQSLKNTLLLQVRDVGFLLDRLEEDCHPLQFLRELTQNVIEAMRKTSEGKGQIVWDVDWLAYEMGVESPFKRRAVRLRPGLRPSLPRTTRTVSQLFREPRDKNREGGHALNHGQCFQAFRPANDINVIDLEHEAAHFAAVLGKGFRWPSNQSSRVAA